MHQQGLFAAAALTLACAAPAQAAEVTLEQKIQILEQELEALKSEFKTMRNKVQPAKPGQEEVMSSPTGLKPAGTTSATAAAGKTTIGGYGELHYNNFRAGDVKDEMDFHRFVLYFGHRFTDRLRLHTEVEYEHSVTGGTNPGEVELEQAYIDYSFGPHANLKAGIMLLPIGALNETHEPPTFFGVERNQVETRVIPTTWWEGGVGVYGEIAQGFSYDAGVVSGFDISRFNNGSNTAPLRRARQKVAESAVNDLGFYGALRYSRPGLRVGAGLFSGNSTQDGTRGASAVRAALKNVDGRITLWDVNAQYAIGKLELRALYAQGRIGDAGAITDALRLDAANNNVKVPSKFDGWYAEAGYRVWQSGDMDLAPFVRYERYDLQKSLPTIASGALARDTNAKDTILTVGVNFKLHPQVVLKADYRDYKNDDRSDSLSLGVGYMF